MAQANILDLKMNRKGFGLRKEVRHEVKGVYTSDLIEEIKNSGYSKVFGRFTVHLARDFGFCYGVDRAVELAYETRRYYPEKRIFLTTEIIHNPTVNQDLLAMGVKFLSGGCKNAKIEDVTKEDVVIVPAFGATIHELQRLHDLGCTLIDTICGSVIVVWKRVEKYAKEGFTSVIHGKYRHEETQATSSRVTLFPNAHYLVILSEEDAQYVCDYILRGGNKEEFLQRFEHSISKGFDPDKHLIKIGIANQTTMLSSESLKIADMLKTALENKFGKETTAEHFKSFDTICSATQERQDAIISLKEKKPDVVLVVGGYNSSNTTHLNEIASTYSQSYHINGKDCLVDRATIRHKPLGKKEESESKGWLPDGQVSIGITGGASTPNSVMGEILEKIISFQ